MLSHLYMKTCSPNDCSGDDATKKAFMRCWRLGYGRQVRLTLLLRFAVLRMGTTSAHLDAFSPEDMALFSVA